MRRNSSWDLTSMLSMIINKFFLSQICSDIFVYIGCTKLEPLLHISEKIWDSFEVNTIQTYHELGAPTSYKNVLDGELPSSEPFSIVSNEDINRIKNVLNDQFLMKKLNRGVLILQKDIGIQYEGTSVFAPLPWL